MAYLGTPPRSRVLSSADIGTGAVTLDDISFTDQPTSVNVSGAINKHTMRLADQVVIDGDVTISDNLILSKISDDGNAITLTNDSSTRTITGSGSLEASTLTQTPNASLTGMTGELGSVVTGSPNLNLGNATFPVGHVVGSQWFLDTSGDYANATTTEKAVRAFDQITVTPGNTIILGFSAWMVSSNSGGQNENKRLGYVNIRYHTSAVSEGTDVSSTGTRIFVSKVGRESNDNSTSTRPQFDAVHPIAAFVASASTYYVGASITSIHSTITSTLKMSASEPYYFYYYELQGDVLS